MDTDFKSMSGGGFSDFMRSAQAFVDSHFGWFFALMIILIILVIALFGGWIGAATKKEGLRSCNTPGYQSQLCVQGRDGPGESLTNSALVQGYGADPVKFCATAGEPTSDPTDYLRATVSSEEALMTMSPTDQLDQTLGIAMQH